MKTAFSIHILESCSFFTANLYISTAKIGWRNYYSDVALMEILTKGDWQTPETKAGEKV